jgi:hypothetical protein
VFFKSRTCTAAGQAPTSTQLAPSSSLQLLLRQATSTAPRLATGPGLVPPAALRVEVADALGERCPDPAGPVRFPAPDAETGRGLRLVDVLATRWKRWTGLPAGR